jgi:hypothetical protein
METTALDFFNTAEREQFLMRHVQIYFEEHGLRGKVAVGFERDGCECLVRDGRLLAYYDFERGEKNLIALFKSAYAVFDYLAWRHLGISKLPLDWPKLNQKFDEQYSRRARTAHQQA